jgi:hypothetical protein
VSGSGQIWNSADAMHFAFQTLSGDGSIVARVVSIITSGNIQPGVMIRESLDPGSTNAFVDVEGGVNFYYRATTGGSTSSRGGVYGRFARD